MHLLAPNINVAHAFTTRLGGVSEGPYDSLNLGLSTGDRREHVLENRRRALALIGADLQRLALLHQVHSALVVEANPQVRDVQADGLVSGEEGVALVVSGADCFPVLVEDPVAGCVGAAHAGWRGVVRGIAGALIDALRTRYGSRPGDLRVALGPGVSSSAYQVGDEVIKALSDAGVPLEVCCQPVEPTAVGRREWRLDLAAAISWQLQRAGVEPGNLWSAGRCTFLEPELFFSHRRDGPRTGRQWGMITT